MTLPDNRILFRATEYFFFFLINPWFSMTIPGEILLFKSPQHLAIYFCNVKLPDSLFI